jgi:hypothetical protein
MKAEKFTIDRNKLAGIICGVLALPCVILSEHNPSASDKSIAGEWIIHFQAEGQSVSGKLHLEVDGDRLTGTIETAHTGNGTIQNGKWTDHRLTATFAFERHEAVALQGEMKLDGTLAGDYHTEGRTETWQAERPAVGSPLTSGVYAPYQSLIGTWDVTATGGGVPVAVQRFSWGPNHSYIWCASSLMVNGKEEPHFEGMLVWNGMHKNLDMLLVIDLKSGRAQEQGTFNVAADGTIVREITGIFSEGVTPVGQTKAGPSGASGHFRQTYKPESADKFLTSVLRETNSEWTATFPGSEHLVMTRRSIPSSP